MRTPSAAEVLIEAIESRLIDVHTALPGKVISFDEETRTAEIKLEIKRMVEKEDGTFLGEELPILPDVRIVYPSSGDLSNLGSADPKSLFYFPLRADDSVLVIFTEASIDQWRSKNGETEPGDARRFSLSGAFAIPANLSNATSDLEDFFDGTDYNANSMILYHYHGGDANTCVVHMYDGITQISDESDGGTDDFVAMAAKVLSELQNVKTDLDDVKTKFDGHIHSGVTAGSGITAGPGDPPTGLPVITINTPHTPASVASGNLKAND
jgi:hypothetical protein